MLRVGGEWRRATAKSGRGRLGIRTCVVRRLVVGGCRSAMAKASVPLPAPRTRYPSWVSRSITMWRKDSSSSTRRIVCVLGFGSKEVIAFPPAGSTTGDFLDERLEELWTFSNIISISKDRKQRLVLSHQPVAFVSRRPEVWATKKG